MTKIIDNYRKYSSLLIKMALKSSSTTDPMEKSTMQYDGELICMFVCQCVINDGGLLSGRPFRVYFGWLAILN